jgi:hypothetical protein
MQLLHELVEASEELPGPRFEVDKSFREFRPLKQVRMLTYADVC